MVFLLPVALNKGQSSCPVTLSREGILQHLGNTSTILVQIPSRAVGNCDDTFRAHLSTSSSLGVPALQGPGLYSAQTSVSQSVRAAGEQNSVINGQTLNSHQNSTATVLSWCWGASGGVGAWDVLPKASGLVDAS
ncbi:hypothetical protein TREES_T100007493 [Tupaia chinensis]|uniref:Uncharacterized protein n=1 Tax=Tupaia chinensis TaxID=246437 RepID=L9KZH1_TUPCH|nr:hypothetical protein TREES_T100007493 [Tupaia chinensis]